MNLMDRYDPAILLSDKIDARAKRAYPNEVRVVVIELVDRRSLN